MKVFSAVLILIVSAALVKSIDPEEQKKMVMKIMGDCKASTGASDDDIAKLLIHAKPESKEGMCMFSCFMEHMGILKGGMINKDGVIAWGKNLNAPEDLMNDIFVECEKISDPDQCVSGMKVGFCLKETGIKHKLKMDF